MKTFRRKGLEFEKEVSRILSKWICSCDELLFWRTHGSGSAKKLGKKFEGDITSIKPESEPFTKIFYVECKRYKDFNISNLLDDKSFEEKRILREYLKKADESNKFLFFVLKRNRSKKTLLFVETPEKLSFDLFMHLYVDDKKLILTTLEDFTRMIQFASVLNVWGCKNGNE